jgi:hypothetical protein
VSFCAQAPCPSKQGKDAATKKKKQPRLTKNSRVYVEQWKLLKIVPPELHSVIKSFGNLKNRRFYGSVQPKSKADGKNYRIRLEDLPSTDNIHKFARSSFDVAQPDEEENTLSREEAQAKMAEILAELEEAEANPSGTRKNYQKESQEAFLGLSFDEQASAKTYEMKYGSRDDQVILWTILSADEQIVTCAMEEYAKKKGRDASATDGVERGGDATAAATGEGEGGGDDATDVAAATGGEHGDDTTDATDGERRGDATGGEQGEETNMVIAFSRQTTSNEDAAGVGNNGKFMFIHTMNFYYIYLTFDCVNR